MKSLSTINERGAARLPEVLRGPLSIPVVGAPMLIVSSVELVIAQCVAGVIGSFPVRNARPMELLDETLGHIGRELSDHNAENPSRPAAPFAVNLVVNRTNVRLKHDLELIVKHRVPIVITSLGAREDVNEAVHSYGGVVLHDVIDNRYALKAIEKGADGLIAVAAGAGGHAGRQSPIALCHEIRSWFDGPLLLSGAIASGSGILAAEAMGADMAYIGSAFIATHEANAQDRYKQMLVESSAQDIVNTDYFSGMPANFLSGSIAAAGLDPLRPDAAETDAHERPKPWSDIWGGGQGVGAINKVTSVDSLVGRLAEEYVSARTRLGVPG